MKAKAWGMAVSALVCAIRHTAARDELRKNVTWRRWRTIAGPAIAISLLGPIAAETDAAAAELTPAIKARLFERARTVSFSRPVVSVPMRGSDHAGNRKCPYVQVYVNGKGPFTFLYDTGSTYLTVSSKVAKAAGASVVVDRGGSRDVVNVDNLSLGGIQVRGILAIVDDNFGVDGVIGFPTLGDAIVSIDFAHREMLLSKAKIPMRNSFTVSYIAPGGVDVPVIPVGIGGETVPILIDTGDDAYALEIRSTELGKAAVEYPPVAAGTVMNGAKKQSTSITVLRDPVTIGPVRAVSATVAINDDLPIGDFGYEALKQFRFQIDPTRRTVTFAPLFRGKVFTINVSRK